jgi:hypothetical protein
MTSRQWNEYQRQADVIEQNEKRKAEKQKTVITPEEKAKELFDLMSGIGDEHHHCTQYVAKQCALIAVDEVLQYSKAHGFIELTEYYEQVKKEIEKL